MEPNKVSTCSLWVFGEAVFEEELRKIVPIGPEPMFKPGYPVRCVITGPNGPTPILSRNNWQREGIIVKVEPCSAGFKCQVEFSEVKLSEEETLPSETVWITERYLEVL